ncbi:MAG: DUF4157 domain-containing protein [Minicystis sp.]
MRARVVQPARPGAAPTRAPSDARRLDARPAAEAAEQGAPEASFEGAPAPPRGFDFGKVAVLPPRTAGSGASPGPRTDAVTLLRREASAAAAQVDDPAVGAALGRRGGGAPLPDGLRREMEPRLGADFSLVRVHTDETAQRAAVALKARAFTVGEDTFFARGAFAPGDAAGRRLIAHELAHVAQLHEGRVPARAGTMRVSDPAEALEREAQAAAEVATAAAPAAFGRAPVRAPARGISAPADIFRQQTPQQPAPPDPAAMLASLIAMLPQLGRRPDPLAAWLTRQPDEGVPAIPVILDLIEENVGDDRQQQQQRRALRESTRRYADTHARFAQALERQVMKRIEGLQPQLEAAVSSPDATHAEPPAPTGGARTATPAPPARTGATPSAPAASQQGAGQQAAGQQAAGQQGAGQQAAGQQAAGQQAAGQQAASNPPSPPLEHRGVWPEYRDAVVLYAVALWAARNEEPLLRQIPRGRGTEPRFLGRFLRASNFATWRAFALTAYQAARGRLFAARSSAAALRGATSRLGELSNDATLRVTEIGERLVDYHEAEVNRGVDAERALDVNPRRNENAAPLVRHQREHQAPADGSPDTHADLVTREMERLRRPAAPPSNPRSRRPPPPPTPAQLRRREERLSRAEVRLQRLSRLLAERDETLARLLSGFQGIRSLLTEEARQTVWREAMHALAYGVRQPDPVFSSLQRMGRISRRDLARLTLAMEPNLGSALTQRQSHGTLRAGIGGLSSASTYVNHGPGQYDLNCGLNGPVFVVAPQRVNLGIVFGHLGAASATPAPAQNEGATPATPAPAQNEGATPATPSPAQNGGATPVTPAQNEGATPATPAPAQGEGAATPTPSAPPAAHDDDGHDDVPPLADVSPPASDEPDAIDAASRRDPEDEYEYQRSSIRERVNITQAQDRLAKLVHGLLGRTDISAADVRSFANDTGPLPHLRDTMRVFAALFFDDTVTGGADVNGATIAAAQRVAWSLTRAELIRQPPVLRPVGRAALPNVDWSAVWSSVPEGTPLFGSRSLFAAADATEVPADPPWRRPSGQPADLAPRTAAQLPAQLEAQIASLPQNVHDGLSAQIRAGMIRAFSRAVATEPVPQGLVDALRAIMRDAIGRSPADASLSPIGGSYVIVQHTYTRVGHPGEEAQISVYYAHMSSVSAPATVAPGTYLGRAGTSGNAVSAHVHMSIDVRSPRGDGHMNPTTFFEYTPNPPRPRRP